MLNLIDLPEELIEHILSTFQDSQHILSSSEHAQFLDVASHLSPTFQYIAQKKLFNSPAIYGIKGIHSLENSLDVDEADKLEKAVRRLSITRGSDSLNLISRLSNLRELTLVGGEFDCSSIQGLTGLERLDLMSVTILNSNATSAGPYLNQLSYVRLGYLDLSQIKDSTLLTAFFNPINFPSIALESHDIDQNILHSLAPGINTFSFCNNKPAKLPHDRFTSLNSIQFRSSTSTFAINTIESLCQQKLKQIRFRNKLDWVGIANCMERLELPHLETIYVDAGFTKDRGLDQLKGILKKKLIQLEFLEELSFEAWAKLVRV